MVRTKHCGVKEELNKDVESNEQQKAKAQDGRHHTVQKEPVIPLSHTVVEPFAVVIKATHTLVARSTVLRFGTPESDPTCSLMAQVHAS